MIALSEVANQAIQTRDVQPLEMMMAIVEVIPDHTGLKEEDGSLRKTYPSEPVLFFEKEKLWFDAATLAHVSCYRMKVFSGGGVVSDLSASVDAIMDAVRSLPQDGAAEAFKLLTLQALEQRDALDGRQTDTEEFMNYNIRRDLAEKYGEHVSNVAHIRAEPKNDQPALLLE